MTWNWHEQVLMKYGITENHHNPKVSRISKNRCRIDNASVANRTTLGFDPDTMSMLDDASIYTSRIDAGTILL